MKLLTSTKLKKKNGKNKHKVEVWQAGRQGSMAPISYYLRYRGKWVCPLAQRLYWNISYTEIIGWHFSSIYREPLYDLLYEENPLLKLAGPNSGAWGGNVSLPIKV